MKIIIVKKIFKKFALSPIAKLTIRKKIVKRLNNLDLNLNITYFKTEQKNPLFSNARTEWVIQNGSGRNTSEGVELFANWQPKEKKIGLDFGYTFTDS